MSPSLNLITKVVKSKDSTNILAEACGDSTKQPIVFVHGLACSGTHFNSLFAIPELQRQFYLVRYDVRGQGRSGKPTTPESHSSERHSDDFEAVCKAFNVKKPIFAGWSAGGAIAVDILHSGKVPLAGIIWISAIPYLGDIMASILPPYVQQMLPVFCTPDEKALEPARRTFCSAFVSPSRASSVPPTEMESWYAAATDMPPESAALFIQRQHDPTRMFQKIKAPGFPVCIIHGKDDLIVLADEFVKGMVPKINSPEVHLLEGVGHIPFWEEPKKVADIVLAFGKRV